MKTLALISALSLACLAAAEQEPIPAAQPAPPKASLSAANQLLTGQQYEEAAKAFEAAGPQKSKKAEAWRLNNWGLCLIRLDRAGQAITPLEGAVAVDPKNFTARANLGAAYERIGDKVKAADTYSRALELLKQENGALAAGKAAKDPEAVANDPVSPTAFIEAPTKLKEGMLSSRLKAAADLMKAENFQGASDLYAKIGMCSGAKREGWKLNNWGLALIRLGKYDEALPRLKKSVDVYPDNPKAWNNLGVAYENLGMTQEAKEAYAKATGASAQGELDAAKVELNQLKLDFNAEKKKWEASK